ncbi:MAG: hypothetical protein WAO58_04110 [Fimbriimonadaceae bacterium]
MEYIVGHAADLPVDPAEIAELQAGMAQWDADFLAHNLAQREARFKSITKTATRASHTKTIRGVVRRLQASPVVSDNQRTGMGIPVRDKIRTRIPPPREAPFVQLRPVSAGRLRVIARSTGEEAKPDGVYACELWAKIGGDPPLDLSECVFMGFKTRTSSYLDFPGEQAGERICVRAMWINRKGERGPMSATASAIIPG